MPGKCLNSGKSCRGKKCSNKHSGNLFIGFTDRRHSDGMTFIRAHLLNSGNWTLMVREMNDWFKHGQNAKILSRGGLTTRSSDEVPVMECSKGEEVIQFHSLLFHLPT